MRTTIVCFLAVMVIALASSLTAWRHPVDWSDPDSVFYQARVVEIRGAPQPAALKHTFEGPIGRAARSWDHSHSYAANPAWVTYSARFYRRRWVVPALAAGLTGAFASRSLQIVSVIGYLLIGGLVYLLLRRRFSQLTSGVVAIACLWLPPVRWYSFAPLTDSWGIALLLAALIAALTVLERGERWLPCWLAVLGVLSVTRETSIVAVGAACVVAALTRTRRALWLAVSGVAVSIPALAILGAPLRETLAYTLNNFERPTDPSWSFVTHHYLPELKSTVRSDLLFPHVSGWSTPHTIVWYIGFATGLVGVLMLLFRRDDDEFFRLIRATLLGAALYIALSVNYSALRLELVFLPAVAVGLALLVDSGQGVLRRVVGRGRFNGFDRPVLAPSGPAGTPRHAQVELPGGSRSARRDEYSEA